LTSVRPARILFVGSVAAVAITAACEPVVDPLPSSFVPFEAPEVYVTWWRMVETCSGLRGDFSRVGWLTAPGQPSFTIDGRPYSGFWFPSGNRILLGDGWTMNGPLVRHEMLHAILRFGDHPRGWFVDKCGGVVVCTSECDPAGEEGHGISPAAREVLPSDLEISVAASPETPSASIDGGWFTITVVARNPAAEPVWVRLPDRQTFGFLPLDGRYSGYAIGTTESRWAFRAGESRRYVFDLNYEPGTYRLDLWFGREHAPALTITVQE
jgi:hypothetical protein